MSQYGWTLVLDACDSVVPYTILGDDTDNLATTTNHITGTTAIEWDKVNGGDDTIFAGADRTVAFDFTPLLAKGDDFWMDYLIGWSFYCSATANISYVRVRVGTDAANCIEYRQAVGGLTAGMWSHAHAALCTGYPVGAGCDWTAITYLAFASAHTLETDLLADMAIDNITIHRAPTTHVAVIG